MVCDLWLWPDEALVCHHMPIGMLCAVRNSYYGILPCILRDILQELSILDNAVIDTLQELPQLAKHSVSKHQRTRRVFRWPGKSC